MLPMDCILMILDVDNLLFATTYDATGNEQQIRSAYVRYLHDPYDVL